MLKKTPSESQEELSHRSSYPQNFGRYALLERLGTGGMADVFRAVTVGSEGFRRMVVIKRVRRSLAGSPEFLNQFRDEAKITALLDHPNIVQVYDFGHIDGAPFLAMEYVQGKDLRVVLRALADTGRRMRPSLAALICRQAAQALHYAHTLRDSDEHPFHIVHRDVNPTNLMLARSGMVKVLDFGIAKASVYSGKAQTEQPVIKGKLAYLSPEQALCQPLDARSDVFSLGATFWEMLTGRRLFAGKSEFERIHNVVEGPIVAPSSLAPGVAPELDAIVMRALERDVERRYQSAQEMAEDLERFLQVEPAGSRAIENVLDQLFGKASSSSGERLPLGSKSGSKGGRDSRSASRRTPPPSGSMRTPTRREGARRHRGLRRTVPMAWAAAVLAIVTVFVAVTSSFVSSLLRAGRDKVVLAATDIGDVEIEIESEPSGALVRSSRGRLGTTPLKLTLPSSSAVERLSVELPGYEREIYDVRPTKSSFVFVELQPASLQHDADRR
jgi:eukaryotic-like serine/threonine-protein kinase